MELFHNDYFLFSLESLPQSRWHQPPFSLFRIESPIHENTMEWFNQNFDVIDVRHWTVKVGRYLFILLQNLNTMTELARTYLQPHYGNGVFGNVYLSAGQHCRHPIAAMGVVDTFGLSQLLEELPASILFDWNETVENCLSQKQVESILCKKHQESNQYEPGPGLFGSLTSYKWAF